MMFKRKIQIINLDNISDAETLIHELVDGFELKYQDLNAKIIKLDEYLQKLEKLYGSNEKIVSKSNTNLAETNKLFLHSISDIKIDISEHIKQMEESNSDLRKHLSELKEVFDLMPEKILDRLQNSTKASLDNISKSLQETIIQNLAPFQKELSEKNDKIKRYEDGYDKKVIDSFIFDLIRILSMIHKERKINDSEILEDIEEDLNIMLKNNGIHRFEMNLGDKYQEEWDRFLTIDILSTQDREKDNTIKEIIKYSYYSTLFNSQNEEAKKPIKPFGKIVIFKYIKEEKNHE